ncbi:hypothetical protein [Peribacillus frigoritolerans]|uniref:Uncharacterized protein n=1 Tax=Peribacillus castrilensis TaxID=2897690 RepID=A0AAW9NR16_9BACI|nr:hypothetical protein [Peribacillus castrilensis]
MSIVLDNSNKVSRYRLQQVKKIQASFAKAVKLNGKALEKLSRN